MTCPACHDTPRDPAFDMDGNAWCAVHAARALADLARVFRLDAGDRVILAGCFATVGASWLAGALDPRPLPFDAELDRLSEPT